MDSEASFFHRRRLSLYLLIVAFGGIALCAMSGDGSFALVAAAWFFPAGLIQSISTQITPHLALLIGYMVYVSLLIALSYARTAPRAQALLIVHLIVVIATVSGCHKVLSGFN